MNCAIFGNRDAKETIKPLLKEVIIHLVKTEEIECFLVGNNGNFDFYAQCILEELKREEIDFNYNIVLSQINEVAVSKYQNRTIFPEDLEKSIPRFAISKRNEWIIKRSSYLICHTKNRFSNSYKMMEKARKKGIKIFEI